jgi:hypothetical protein
MIVDDYELEEMMRIIVNWAGQFDLHEDSHGYFHGVLGQTSSGPLVVGPGSTKAGIIQIGYGLIYSRMWGYAQ